MVWLSLKPGLGVAAHLHGFRFARPRAPAFLRGLLAGGLTWTAGGGGDSNCLLS